MKFCTNTDIVPGKRQSQKVQSFLRTTKGLFVISSLKEQTLKNVDLVFLLGVFVLTTPFDYPFPVELLNAEVNKTFGNLYDPKINTNFTN